MAKTQDLKRRIRSVGNTRKLTRAMKMVAAAKLRRAQERMVQARPYTERMRRVLHSLAGRAGTEEHPLLRVREPLRIEVVVITADKGLCGSFNAGVFREARGFIETAAGRQVKVNAVGKKGRDYFSGRTGLSSEWIDVFRKVEFQKAKQIADELIERYVGEEVDAIHLVYNEFKSAVQAKPVVQRLLPIEADELEADEPAGEYLYEPSSRQLFAALLPDYVRNQVYQAMLESAAAEHAARMTAMDSATNNAGELIDNLTLTMNRVRQTSITTEIIEVVSGAEALG